MKPTCMFCGKELVYNIVEDNYEFCSCEEAKVPEAKDNVSMADQFELDIDDVIFRYSDQGLTIGTIIGALQNRAFSLSLNLHMPSIISIMKKHLK